MVTVAWFPVSDGAAVQYVGLMGQPHGVRFLGQCLKLKKAVPASAHRLLLIHLTMQFFHLHTGDYISILPRATETGQMRLLLKAERIPLLLLISQSLTDL